MRKTIDVIQTVGVEIDETKLTREWMQEFRNNFYEFYSLHDHLEHLAQLYVRGLIHGNDPFIEGYGFASEMGIKFHA